MRTSGRYGVVKKIADGGMAEIFLARQSGAEGFSRSVIVKRILPAFSADPHFRNMLVDEAHIAMTLNHSNIVPVLDLGQAGGFYFLVLELVDGWDLATIRQRAQSGAVNLPLGLALYIVAEVCRALAYAHGRKDGSGKPLGIVHRDVSPQNVLLSEQGEVKVADFGIAKALGKRERTQTGIIKGKLEYMSPEQALGAPIDASSDVFAVGTLLYLMATNRRPFAAPSDFEALLKVQRAEFEPPEKGCPGLSPAVANIIKKAMQARPADRYRSAEEMMVAVETVLRGEMGSPGQSELKRWLSDLTARDGALPVSRRPGIAAADALSHRWLSDGEVLMHPVRADAAGDPAAFEAAPVVSGFGQTAVAPGTPAPRRLSDATKRPTTAPTSPLAPRRKPRWLRDTALACLLVGIVSLAATRLVSQDKQQQFAAAARAFMKKGVDRVSAVWAPARKKKAASPATSAPPAAEPRAPERPTATATVARPATPDRVATARKKSQRLVVSRKAPTARAKSTKPAR